VPYLRLVRGRQCIVIDYDRLVSQPKDELIRMANGLGLTPNESNLQSIDRFANQFIRNDLRHTRFTIEELQSSNEVNHLVRRAYGLLDSLASAEPGPAPEEFWDEWAKVEQEVAKLGPILERLDALEGERRLAQWNPFSPVAALWATTKRLIRLLPVRSR